MRRRLLFLALGIGALLFVGVLAWHFFYSPPALTKTLTDGSTVTFLKITTGTNHTHLTGTILQRTAARFLSDAWLRKLKITRARGQLNFRAFAMSNSNHVFWVNLSGPSFIQPMPGGNFIYNVTVGDDAGGEMKNQSLSTYRTPDGQLCAFAISILPTGSPRLRVKAQRRLFTNGRDVYANTSETLAEFVVPNPDFIPHPGWSVTSLPISNELEGFDLSTLQVDVYADEPNQVNASTSRTRCEISGLVEARPGSTNRWKIRQLRIFNEAGREMDTRFENRVGDSGRIRYTSHNKLSTNSLWKLRFTLTATAQSGNESHTFSNIPTPGVSTNTFTPLRAQVGGFTLSITNLISPSRTNPVGSGQVHATLQPSDPSRRLECVRSASVPRGVTLTPVTIFSTENYYHGRQAIPMGSDFLNLTFEWKREHVVEVIVRPQTAKSAWKL